MNYKTGIKIKISNEQGLTLALVLIYMLLGSILIAAVLSFVSTGIKVQSTIKTGGDELYAADAGVRDGLWQIKYNDFGDVTGYDAFDYETGWSYNLNQNVNNLPVTVTAVQNIWIPGDNIDISSYDPTSLRNIIEMGNTAGLADGDTGYTGSLYIKGSTTGDITTATPADNNFQIKISYTGDNVANLRINQIGIWIPDGFSYVTGSSDLEADSLADYHLPDVTPTTGIGGDYIIWEYTSYPFAGSASTDALPDYVSSENTGVISIDLKLKRDLTTSVNKMPEIMSWVVTEGSISYLPFAWDNDIQIYKVAATAGSTTVEAYTVKSELRELASAIAGDYFAAGQSLMIDTNSVAKFRERLLTESTTVISAIPENATVDVAYLYWAGWVKEYGNGIFWDQCNHYYINEKWNPIGTWSLLNSSATDQNYTDEYKGTGNNSSITLKDILDLSGLTSSATISWDQTLVGISPTGYNITTVPTGDGDVSGNWISNSGGSTPIIKAPSSNSGTAWTNPVGAYTDGGTSATTISGTGNNMWGDYGFQLHGYTVTGVRVGFDAWGTASPGGSAPTYVGAGSVDSGTGSISPGLPSGWTQNDIFLLFVETGSETFSPPSGWSEINSSPQSSTGTRLTIFWKRAGSSESAPTISDPGNHVIGQILAFRGCITSGDPWDITAGNTSSSSSSVSIPGATTSVDNCLIVLAVANGTDSNNSQTSGWSNANLTGLTERVDNNTRSGNGGGFGVATGIKLAAGNYGNTTASLSTASFQGRISIALKPVLNVDEQIKIEVSGNGGANWYDVATVTLTESETSYWYDVSTIGITWDADTLDDGYLMIRASALTVGSTSMVYLDYLPVEVTYTSELYPAIDETIHDDSDYITGSGSSSGSYYALFTFDASDFSIIPANASVTNITVYYRVKDSSSGTNNIRAAVKVDGYVYDTVDSGYDPTSSFTFSTRNYSFTTNPATGANWTVDDIKGIGSHPLEQFGVSSSDLNPAIQVSMVYAQVNYTISTDSLILAISTNSGATFTDLGNYSASGPCSYTLEQGSGYVGSGANNIKIRLYLSGFTIPTKWVELDNILITDDSITANYDPSVNFEINSSGKQMVNEDIAWSEKNLSDRNGYIVSAIQGNDYITVSQAPGSGDDYNIYAGDYINIEGTNDYYEVADQGYSSGRIYLTTNYSGPNLYNVEYYELDGYFYACKADVTTQVKMYSKGADLSDIYDLVYGNGNGSFTVGDMYSDTQSVMNPGKLGDASFAGWSLVIIYSSPETKGHQLYIFDSANGYARALPSGTTTIESPIGGFIVPEQITGETDTDDVTKLTIFVGEGDEVYTGDYVAFIPTDTGIEYKLWDGITCSANTAASPNNAFNSRFIDAYTGAESTFAGVDIDTFHITWGQGLLEAGDTSATIKQYTTEGYVLVFMIVSFRSETTTGGTISYLIE